jgi:hypothetical protein
VSDFLFGDRSIWQDAVEVFRLSANRTLLGHPEERPTYGSQLEKLFMSGLYVEDVIRAFKGRKASETFRSNTQVQQQLMATIENAKAIDPERVNTISSFSQPRQSAYGTVCFLYQGLRSGKRTGCTIGRAQPSRRSGSCL